MRNYRVIADYCINRGKEEWLARWDANEMTMKSLLAKATGKSQADPRAPKTKRPRCMSYSACYALYQNQEVIENTIRANWDVDPKVGLEIYRAALLEVMQTPKYHKEPVPPEGELESSLAVEAA